MLLNIYKNLELADSIHILQLNFGYCLMLPVLVCKEPKKLLHLHLSPSYKHCVPHIQHIAANQPDIIHLIV